MIYFFNKNRKLAAFISIGFSVLLLFDLINVDMTKKAISGVINACYRSLGLKETVIFADQLMYTGFQYATRAAVSFGIHRLESRPAGAGFLKRNFWAIFASVYVWRRTDFRYFLRALPGHLLVLLAFPATVMVAAMLLHEPVSRLRWALVLGGLYALPNLFGESPAVQVSPARLREFPNVRYLPKPFPLETLLAPRSARSQ